MYNWIVKFMVFALLFGCKGGGENLFSGRASSLQLSELLLDIRSEIAVGSVVQPKVTLVDTKGNRFLIDSKEVSWSFNKNEVEVNNGSFTFIKKGDISISASYLGIESKTVNVSVDDLKIIDVELISYEKDVEIAFSPNLNVYGARSFILIAHYNDGTYIDVTEHTTWTSSDDTVIEFLSLPLLVGTVKSTGVGVAMVTADYQGFTKNVEVYSYDADITNYPTKCGTEYIVVPVPQLRKELTFKCPPIGKRNGDYNSTQTIGFPGGIINAILPYFSYQSAENYCSSLGYRLPTWKEHLLLRSAVNSGPTAPHSLYLLYGWPQIDAYWLSGDTQIPGQKYVINFSSHSYYFQDETDWGGVTALCVKESILTN
ncbi:hypothetical protein [Vibrio brasiliensis]|uniref:hypothetical protein n=1 Tax=Vibrio brasiliensis TaxID=170652 RepID=UPI001EFCD245|nr:hypothetical protein [Vibrio brasiliensis]MCG9726136.1 hypothetical protein [Vibrio brasiliensis]